MLNRTLIAFSTLLLSVAAYGQDQQIADLGKCDLESGEVIESCRVGYRTLGSLNAAGDNAILVPTWFTGTSEELVEMVRPELLDPVRYFIVLADALGNGVSSSPSNSPDQPFDQFPTIGIRDMVRAHHRLVTEVLGLERLHAVVGASMGGMQAFQWAVSYPGFAAKTVPVIGSPRLAAFDITLWETRIELLELYRACDCFEAKQLMAGVSMLGSDPALLGEDIDRTAVRAAIDQRAIDRKLDAGVTYDVERQARAMINHDISRGFGGDLAAAAEAVKTEMLIVVGSSDRIVTPGPALSFAEIVGARTLVLDSPCGHGAPWCEAERHDAAVREFLGTSH